mgnify:FL=1
MRDYVILSDSCCDLDADLRKKYGIEYIPMRIIFGDTDIPASLDWEKISPKEFYDMMRGGVRVRTAQINADEFKEAFSKYLDEGKDVMYIACPSALSNSYKSSLMAHDILAQERPDGKIVCIDSRNACLGLGMICMTASELRAEGKSIDETAQYIEAHKQEVNQFATVESLNYLKRAGRVSTTSAVFGGLLQVKPIIISDADGQNVAVEKVKGRKNSLVRLADLFKETYRSNPHQRICIGHADAPEAAEELKTLVKERMPEEGVEVITAGIGPIIGATTGPGTLAVYCYGKEVTYRASEAQNK